MMFDKPLPEGASYTGIPDDYDVVRVDAREIYLVGYRQPDGRHGPGLDKFDRQLEKGAVATMRNWNTIPKVLTLITVLGSTNLDLIGTVSRIPKPGETVPGDDVLDGRRRQGRQPGAGGAACRGRSPDVRRGRHRQLCRRGAASCCAPMASISAHVPHRRGRHRHRHDLRRRGTARTSSPSSPAPMAR